jgi:hypothetical protein
VSENDFLRVEANECPMSSCAAPAGLPCRTGRGKVAVQYHTARFRLVPQLAKALSIPVPPLRRPGSRIFRSRSHATASRKICHGRKGACDEDRYRILSQSIRSGRRPVAGGRLVVR